MIKALIFDFDGLIVDTESAIYQSYCEIYAEHNCSLPLERWAQGIGTTDSQYDPYADLEEIWKSEKGAAHGAAQLKEDMEKVPEGSNLGLGCGNPVALASIKKGDTVLYLGSGAGFDCFLAAEKVGPSGKVIGVDIFPRTLGRVAADDLVARAVEPLYDFQEL